MPFPFEISAVEGRARTGLLKTTRGDIRTPAFMPVGTAATVKAMTLDQVKQTGADIILGNTYHLMLRPGPERMERLGGLHNFMRWDKPILTDSGGFQVMSLSGISKLTEEAVTFSSHIDGSKHVLTPERSIQIQADRLGSDIVMQLDECVAWPAEEKRAREGMELSARWAQRSKNAFGTRDAQALFGIQQGSTFEHLRRESSERLQEIGFDGYAIGGLAVGEGHEAMCEVLDYAPEFLPKDRPRYLMGVGKPIDLVEAVYRGVDMFDCVLPTRAGRHGQAAQGVAVEADLLQALRGFPAQVLIGRALLDAEQGLRIARAEGVLGPLRPAGRQFHALAGALLLGGPGDAFVQLHDDVGAEAVGLNLDRAFRR